MNITYHLESFYEYENTSHNNIQIKTDFNYNENASANFKGNTDNNSEFSFLDYNEFCKIFNKKDKETSKNETEPYLNEIRRQLIFRTDAYTKKKRGRKENEDNINKKSKIQKKIHDKNTADNILIKIQVHFLSFLISFLNDILLNLNYEQRFFNLDHKFKRNVKREFIQSLKSKDIGTIISNPISSKYKKDIIDRNINKFIYNEIKENNELKKLFSENYINIFRKFYYPSNKLINLREYGIDQTINLSDEVKMYEDLIKENESSDSKKDYKTRIDKCIAHYFLPQIKFKII